MIRECFVDEFQGHRWLFRVQKYTDKVDMIDTLGELPTIELTKDAAEILSKQLANLQTYQNNDRENMLIPERLLNFVRENKDIDNDIILALINKFDIVIK